MGHPLGADPAAPRRAHTARRRHPQLDAARQCLRGRQAGTLALQTEDGLQRPERWCDSPSPSDVPERGQRIVLPVSVTFYQGKGGTGCRLTWGAASRGEEF